MTNPDQATLAQLLADFEAHSKNVAKSPDLTLPHLPDDDDATTELFDADTDEIVDAANSALRIREVA